MIRAASLRRHSEVNKTSTWRAGAELPGVKRVMAGKPRAWRRVSAPLQVLLSILLLTACSDVRNTPDLPARDVYRQIGDIDLSPRAPLRPLGQAGSPDDPLPRAASYVGRADPGAPPSAAGGGPMVEQAPAGGASGAASDTYQLSFENAPVAAVVKAILGDTLGLSYTIDPRVQASVSLSFGRPLPRDQILFALENALRLSNAALVRDGAGYRVVPATEAVGAVDASAGRVDEPGFGLSVYPLRYVAATTMLKLMDGFATRPNAIRADPARNLLLIQGTASERQAALQTVQTFDADWMRGQSVGVYPVRNAAPQAIIGELENIMLPNADAQEQKPIKFQPMERLNAVLVVTRRPDLLSKAATWIARLDRTDASANSIKVYRVRYGEAKHIADVLNGMFSGTPVPDDTNGQTAPGSGSQTTRSDPLGDISRLGAQSGGSSSSAGGLGSNGSGGGFGTAGGLGTAGAASSGGGGNQPYGTLSAAGFPSTRGGGAASTASTGTPDSAAPPPGQVAGGVRVTADSVTNSLLIFADRENYKLVERALQELDRPALQVAIEATIAEVTLNNNLSYGVQYFLKSQDAGLNRDRGSAGLSTNSVLNGVITKVLPGANLVLGPDADPRIVLDALRAYTDVKVISSPSLVVLDNQVASLQVGDSVPIATSSATLVSAAASATPTASVGFPVANTIDYRNTGVILRVLPRVNYNGNVSLDVEQEISSIVPNTSPDTLTPTISERRIKSTIAVASGQTVLLAGLISDTQDNSRSGLPIVERIQVLGDLFSSNNRAHTRTELIIFIRPRIVRDGNDAADVAEELRSKILASDGQPGRGPVYGAPPLARRY